MIILSQSQTASFIHFDKTIVLVVFFLLTMDQTCICETLNLTCQINTQFVFFGLKVCRSQSMKLEYPTLCFPFFLLVPFAFFFFSLKYNSSKLVHCVF